jgi:hypothetical protein
MCKKCIVCGQPAVWYGQQMDGPNEKLTFTAPGYHYRGFKIHPVCDSCWQFGWSWTALEWADAVNKGELVNWYHKNPNQFSNEHGCDGQYKQIGMHCEEKDGPHGPLAILQCTKCGHITHLYQGILDNLA